MLATRIVVAGALITVGGAIWSAGGSSGVGGALMAQSPAIQAQAGDQGAAIHAAIRNDDIAALKALANAGTVNVSERRTGATPLMYAAALGSLESLRLLLEAGADVNARSAIGATALMWGATDSAKVELLVRKGADVNAVSESGNTVLLLAAKSDESASIVRALLDRGARMNVANRDGMTPLIAATLGGDLDTVKIFIERGGDVNAVDGLGSTPLMYAAQQGDVEVVRMLLARGARVNAVSGPPLGKVKNGTIALGRFTPLIFASAYGPLDLVRVLVDAGADVNAREARGMTPLMYNAATDHGDSRITALLLERGADPAVRTPEGESAADWAQKVGASDVLRLLRARGADSQPVPAHNLPPAALVADRVAVARAIGLLERTSGSFLLNGACGGCHAQMVTEFAVATARKSGVVVDGKASAQRLAGASLAFGATATQLYERTDGPSVDILLTQLWSFAAAGHPADRATDALVFNVLAQQGRAGNWHVGGVTRPPMADGDVSRTAMGIRAITAYHPAGRRDEIARRVKRATVWLLGVKPVSAEDRAFRLLGLFWGQALEPPLRAAATREILAAQHDAGGWGQRNELASDAYATGLTLYALREVGALAPSDPAAARAVRYLLSTQREDGSWYVRSRAPKFQPYFESGFPYAGDQWISSMATGWAAAAIAAGFTSDGPPVAAP